MIRYPALVVLINLNKSLVKQLEFSQITTVLFYIFEKTQSYGLREPSKGTNIIYQKRVFENLANQLKIYKIPRRETIFFYLWDNLKIRYGFAEA